MAVVLGHRSINKISRNRVTSILALSYQWHSPTGSFRFMKSQWQTTFGSSSGQLPAPGRYAASR